MGYEHASMVTTPGEFSRRGGIIDIYPITEAHPIRIEMFDDEVDSIRYFDADTQRSLDRLQTVAVGPATELLLTNEDILTGAHRLEEAFSASLKKLKTNESKEALVDAIEGDIERLKGLEHFKEMHKYIGFFYDKPASLLDYLPTNGFVILDEMSRIQETATNLDHEEAEWYSSLLEASKMVVGSKFSFDCHSVFHDMNATRVYMSVFLRHIPNTNPDNSVMRSARAMQEFHGQMNLVKNELKRWAKGEFSVVVAVPSKDRAE